ncbi:S53 family serine peptidase [Hymenobacter sp. ASUV-10]|uniref:S53 family serine peptidase n=1 Tax=Hymenobacter aranciens TaxID=3063996 RepID=A0ABT9B913_9BACT|nr:S53 family serine peptidase [Hymenobacter sp. ASUV-10]MDO7874755.1 S53 family serine peptidase [Hymenobacter sp. ASUV-10]
MNESFLAVPHSAPQAAGTLVGYPNPARPLSITLSLRRQTPSAEQAAQLTDLVTLPPHLRHYPSHEELAATLGTTPDDMATVSAYFEPFGLQVTSSSLLTGSLTLTGPVAAVEQAFHTVVATFQTAAQTRFLATTTALQLPASLLTIVQQAPPLERPVRVESRTPTKPRPAAPAPEATATPAPPAGCTPQELAQAYQFPTGLNGEGQVMGFVELGGKLNQADFKQFFAQAGLKKPRVIEVGTPPASTGLTELMNNAEVALDLQVAGALAPQARLVVYYGSTLLEALRAIVADDVNRPSVVSISWAGSEYNYSAADVAEMNNLLYMASLLGITLVAASADHGAYNGLAVPNVSLPSSNPLVLGCGGTIDTLADGQLQPQVVWNEANGQDASGGGYSMLYPQPYYQYQAVSKYPYQKSTMRGVPDVAADASGVQGYRVVFNGHDVVIGGTSAATPFTAALLTLISQQLGYRLGFLNSVLYGFAGSEAFRPITEGNNQLYYAAPYWNPCTGLGSLVGQQLLQLLQHLESASMLAPTSPEVSSEDVAEKTATSDATDASTTGETSNQQEVA